MQVLISLFCGNEMSRGGTIYRRKEGIEVHERGEEIRNHGKK